MDKITNPISGYKITKGGDQFRTLIRTGKCIYDEETDTLSLGQGIPYPLEKIFLPNHPQKVQKYGEAYFAFLRNPQPPSHPPTVPSVPSDPSEPFPALEIVEPLSLSPIIPITVIPTDVTYTHIIHLADIHIPKNLYKERREEYNQVFAQLEKQLRELPHIATSLIVVVGDLVDDKLQHENETLLLAHQLAHQLSAITTTVFTLGNHDFSEQNATRTDTISVITAGTKVIPLTASGAYQFNNLILAFSSLLDQQLIAPNQIDSPLPKIGVFHGSLVGARNDNGQIVQAKPKYPTPEFFKNFDFTILGHIHKHQFITPTIAYSGSLIQQKVSESPTEHGFIEWTLATRTPIFHQVMNMHVILKLIISDSKIQNEEDLHTYHDKKITLRVAVSKTPPAMLDTIINNIKQNFNIVSVAHMNSVYTDAQPAPSEQPPQTYTHTLQDDLQQLSHVATPKNLQQLQQLHTQYYTTSREANGKYWYPIKLQFTNVFIYGNNKENIIDFVNGVNNICAPNTSGKSSIIKIIFYVLFKSVPIGQIKADDIIAKGESRGKIELVFVCNSTKYRITRELDVRTGAHARNTVKYERFSPELQTFQNLSGSDSLDTERKIREDIGTKDDLVNYNLITTDTTNTFITLLPAERMRSFERFCKVERFQDYVAKCKEELTITAARATLISSHLAQITTTRTSLASLPQPSTHALDTLHNSITQLKVELTILQSKRDELTHHIATVTAETSQTDPHLHYTLSDLSSIQDTLSQLPPLPPTAPSIEVLEEHINSYESIPVPRAPTTITHEMDQLTPSHPIDTSLATLETQKIIIQHKMEKIDKYTENTENIEILNAQKIQLQEEINTLLRFQEENHLTTPPHLPVPPPTTNFDPVPYPFTTLIVANNKLQKLTAELQKLSKLEAQETSKLPLEIEQELSTQSAHLQKLRQGRPIDTTQFSLSEYTELSHTSHTQDSETSLREQLNKLPPHHQMPETLTQPPSVLSKASFEARFMSPEFFIIMTTLIAQVTTQISLLSPPKTVQFTTNLAFEAHVPERVNQPPRHIDAVMSDITATTSKIHALQEKIDKIPDTPEETTQTIDELKQQIRELTPHEETKPYKITQKEFTELFTLRQQIPIAIKAQLAQLKQTQSQTITVPHTLITLLTTYFDREVSQDDITILEYNLTSQYNAKIEEKMNYNIGIMLNNTSIYQRIKYKYIQELIQLKTELNALYTEKDIYTKWQTYTQWENYTKEKTEYTNYLQQLEIYKQRKEELEYVLLTLNKIAEETKWQENNDKRAKLERMIRYVQLHKMSQQLSINTNIQNIEREIHGLKLCLVYAQKLALEEEISHTTLTLHSAYNQLRAMYQETLSQLTAKQTQLTTVDTKLAYHTYTQYQHQLQQLDTNIQYLRLHNELEQSNEYTRKTEKNTSEKQILHRKRKEKELVEITNILKRQDLAKQTSEKTQITEKIIVLNEKIAHIQHEIEKETATQAVLTHQHAHYQELTAQEKTLNEELATLTQQLELYKEYITIFSPGGIPMKMTEKYIDMLNQSVSKIFSRFSKYDFQCAISQGVKPQLTLRIVNKETKKEMPPMNLSGFEQTLLTLAINYSMARINNNCVCGMLFIDEKFDCIDATRWTTVMPEMLRIIREYYQIILFISHRDVAKECIDTDIRITHDPITRTSSITPTYA